MKQFIFITIAILLGVIYNLYQDVRLLQSNVRILEEAIIQLRYDNNIIEDKLLVLKSTAYRYYFTEGR